MIKNNKKILIISSLFIILGVALVFLGNGSKAGYLLGGETSPSRISTFLGLHDTPDTYSGQANKFLRVNSSETGIDFVENSIATTTASLITLINNSILVPSQWYLITDFQNETFVPNTDGVITEGAVEEIYLQASGVNTIYPTGFSKTYPDEEIRYKQDPVSITLREESYYDGGTSEGDFIIAVLDTDKIQFNKNILQAGATEFYLNYYNYANNSYAEMYLEDEGTLWTYDPVTFILTVLSVNDFEGTPIAPDFGESDAYFDMAVTNVAKDFTRGMIVGRHNNVNGYDVAGDYRSQLTRRYKPDVANWSAGTYAIGSVVNYGNVIWGALVSTSATPSTASLDWIKLCNNDYLLSANINITGKVSFSIPIKTTDYQDKPILDVAQLDALDYPVNVTIKNLYQYDYLDVFITSLSGFRNATISGDKATITAQISDSTISLTNSLLAGANYSTLNAFSSIFNASLTTVTFPYAQGVLASGGISYSGVNYLSGVTFRTNVGYLTGSYINQTLFRNAVTTVDIANMSSVDFANSVTDSRFSKIYNCSFSNLVTGAKFFNEVYYTNFLNQWLRNTVTGRMYGTSDAVRQTYGYTADNNFLGNATLNFISSSTNIVNNTFNSSFSNNFTAATSSNATFRLDGNTFNGPVINISGAGILQITANTFANGINNLVINNGTTYTARLSQNFFAGDFGAGGVPNTFANTTAEFNVRYNVWSGAVYGLTFSKGSVEYNTFQGRAQNVVFGGTDTQDFTYNTVGNQFVSNNIDASITRCQLPQYWSSRSITSVMTDLVLLADNENTGIGTDAPNSIFSLGGSFSAPYVSKSANYTLSLNDYTVEGTANTFTISLPTAVGITGRIYNIKNSGTGVITIDPYSTQTIDGAATSSINQWEKETVQSTGSNWIKI